MKQTLSSQRFGKPLLRAVVIVTSLLVLSSATLALDPDAKRFPVLRQWTAYLGLASETLCDGLCQDRYCDSIINGQCYVNGHPSGCIGCVGNCTGAHQCSCKAGGERLLFGLQRLAAQPTLVLVEGELNAVSLWQCRRDLSIDVFSWGAQGNRLQEPVTRLAIQVMQHYQSAQERHCHPP